MSSLKINNWVLFMTISLSLITIQYIVASYNYYNYETQYMMYINSDKTQELFYIECLSYNYTVSVELIKENICSVTIFNDDIVDVIDDICELNLYENKIHNLFCEIYSSQYNINVNLEPNVIDNYYNEYNFTVSQYNFYKERINYSYYILIIVASYTIIIYLMKIMNIIFKCKYERHVEILFNENNRDSSDVVIIMNETIKKDCDICYDRKKVYILKCCNESKFVCNSCYIKMHNETNQELCAFCRNKVELK